MTGQLAYWNGPGAAKVFTHPVHSAWAARFGRQARILDYGCGYGRVMVELTEQGFSDVRGADPSAALIARGRRMRPDLRFEVLQSPPALPYAAASFDVVLLFAVLTCVPDEEDQRALVAELGRVLAPGGLLHVSDLLLQDDDRNRDRYAAPARRSGAPYGVFVTDDGAVCRHHGIADLHALLADMDVVDERRIDVGTMNGHRSRAVQMLCRKR
ncbi:class I SAM-dependent methyltransferase [Streptomyces griseorubiginosus]|uniref:class I SAM-dependent methyltransferase n=1 Tax=Streptomyces griseorubiginosus TaxID=67304 RepID=UPI001AD7E016|nr:class I SAM-dependent methyltransferase [Streptomyces griseorubiginosus]MBO4252686.1 methyltransferase domain-containing protein [Streptomyces griseorubiginosus]